MISMKERWPFPLRLHVANSNKVYNYAVAVRGCIIILKECLNASILACNNSVMNHKTWYRLGVAR